MKLPKTIIICGRTFKVVKDKKISGGYFRTADQIIGFGSKNKPTDDTIREVFMHEIVEAVFALRCLRFHLTSDIPENGDYIFVLNHQQFDDACVDIAFALKGIQL